MTSVPGHETFIARCLSWPGRPVATVVLLASTRYLVATPAPHQQIVTEVVCWFLIYVARWVYVFFAPGLTGSSLPPRITKAADGNTIALYIALLCLSSSVGVVSWSVVSIPPIEISLMLTRFRMPRASS